MTRRKGRNGKRGREKGKKICRVVEGEGKEGTEEREGELGREEDIEGSRRGGKERNCKEEKGRNVNAGYRKEMKTR